METTKQFVLEANSGSARTIVVTVKKGEASLSELNQCSRWYQQCGSSVVSVSHVTVWLQAPSLTKMGQPDYLGTPGYEVQFRCGSVGLVIREGAREELMAVVTPDSQGYITGVWKKRGRLLGHAVPWFMAQHQDPDTRNSSASELYAMAQGEDWENKTVPDLGQSGASPMPMCA